MTVTVVCAVLFDASASAALVAAVIVDDATLLPAVFAVAENANDCDAPTARLASVHVAVPFEIVQPVGGVPPMLTPAAGAKVSVAALLASGPALLA